MNLHRHPLTACTVIALLLAASLPAPQAAAQSATVIEGTASSSQTDSPPERWIENIGEQTRQLLEEPDAVRQDRAMILVVRHASRPELSTSFRPAVPRLFEIYESDIKDERRLLALAALNAIGEPSVMKRLAECARAEKEGKVYRHTLSVLAADQN